MLTNKEDKPLIRTCDNEQLTFAGKLSTNSAVATFLLDREHTVIMWNKACEELTGVKEKDIRGTKDAWKGFYPDRRSVLADLVLNGDHGDIQSLYQKVSRSTLHAEGLHASGWYENLNGIQRYIIFDAVPIYDEQGGLIAALETLQDITDQMHAEEALQQKNLALLDAYTELKNAQSQILHQEKMASIGQLAAGVAHEINNPMGFIMSNLNTLEKYIDKISEFVKIQSTVIKELGEGSQQVGNWDHIEEKKRSLKIDYIMEDITNLIKESHDGAERVKKIVQDLKSFSRVDEAEYKLADINSGLESTINIVWNELKYKSTLRRKYGDIPLTKCKPGQLNQVFLNLLVNASHAIEHNGEIKVQTWHEKGCIQIAITDTGSGIPEDIRSRIFEPFFTTKEVGKGTGLGLSIAYDIIKKHHGEIKVESTVGKGTTFTISIPVVEA
jgi:two-component system, NtrC family, sensor kinase